ncbi:MAG: methyltransferase domain-containing protein, partial [Actinomycetota bacterium]|nr:methyltransferase domain-containing protein [Actinomycetota bacterium]
FCGAGTILVEALRAAAPGLVIGSDTNESAVRLARKNVEAAAAAAGAPAVRLFVADAGSRRVPAGSVDRVLANLPFGKRVGSHTKNVALYPRFAGTLAKVLKPDGLAVLLTEEKRLLRGAVERTRGLTLADEHVVEIGGLTPTAFVVRAA